jgi:glycosyltransferase involved in cell wall biosynthesis
LILSLPDIRFSVVAIKAEEFPLPQRMVPPDNIIEIIELPLSVAPSIPHRYAPDRIQEIGQLLLTFVLEGDSATLAGLTEKLDALSPRPAAGDILSSPAMFAVLSRHYSVTFPAASFHHYFWAMRTLLGGLLAILLAPLPRAKIYHTLSTGFAGLLAARAVAATGRQAFITEHGIYQLERHIEIMMATWIGDQVDTGLMLDRKGRDLRDLWLAAFQSYARACYDACDPIIALYSANNETQERLGAPPQRLRVIPNGVDPKRFADVKIEHKDGLLVALIGRVVPIKDIKTFIRAAALVHAQIPNARFVVLGPKDEDPGYAADCEELVDNLSLDGVFEMVGRVNIIDWIPKIDVLVLTSLSEAQPLVILECGACGIPAVAPDVGSCREMIEGRGPDDDRPGGIVTALVDPEATAKAVSLLLRDPSLRREMGEALRDRTVRDYDMRNVVAAYRHIYMGGERP